MGINENHKSMLSGLRLLRSRRGANRLVVVKAAGEQSVFASLDSNRAN